MIAAWGVNAGHSFSNTDDGFTVDAFYDVPIGSVYFSPGMRVMFSVNSMFSVETRVRFELIAERLLLGAGANVMIWEDRAAIGIPVELTAPIRLLSRLQLNPGVAFVPHFFLGKEKDGALTTVFVGLRVPVL